MKLFVFFFGFVVILFMVGVWGMVYWNLWDMFDVILDYYWMFVVCIVIWMVFFSYILFCIVVNFGVNSFFFGFDIVFFVLKYIIIVCG